MHESQRQNLGQVPDKVAHLSRTQIIKVGDVICVTDFHDLCLQLCRNLSRTLLQNRNGIWAFVTLFAC